MKGKIDQNKKEEMKKEEQRGRARKREGEKERDEEVEVERERNKEFGKEKVKYENHVTKHAVPQTEQE